MKTILLSNVNNDIAEHLFICVFDHRFEFEALPFDRWKKYDVFCKCKYRRYNISSGGGEIDRRIFLEWNSLQVCRSIITSKLEDVIIGLANY